ncbi:histone deacetylase [Guyparkeria hydrothermalis]|uniref:histone deacetylase family protein n=1 Tax=Guyparkeria hydrothermalis TaxID=923 RepID=UPI002021E442|nr:histone deacetylase [Guyparkeria hydrothermalis]MCL7744147.1 histone deacetylase [Guyparkeria hydrothermalis]
MEESMLVYYDARMLAHNPTGWDADHPEWSDAVKTMIAHQYPDASLETYTHPECPTRMTAIVDRLWAEPIDDLQWRTLSAASPAQLQRVHTGTYLAYIESLAGRSGWLAQDTTAVSPDSVAAARLAAGAGISAVEAVAEGDDRHAFCIVRPPGHHASTDHPMGFCLYNNIAVAAAHARAALGHARVMIWDWDMHHGNGTQAIFYDRPDVLVVDSHCAAPFYPGTGHLEETGTGPGDGFHLNVPLPRGSGNAALLAVFEQVIQPAARAFEPDLILISAGFDCHYLDQTCAMDETGYAALTERVCALAEELCDSRLVLMLEGGYNPQGLADSAHAAIRALAGHTIAAINVLPEDEGCAAVAEAARFHANTIARLGYRPLGGAAGRRPASKGK